VCSHSEPAACTIALTDLPLLTREFVGVGSDRANYLYTIILLLTSLPAEEVREAPHNHDNPLQNSDIDLPYLRRRVLPSEG